jgi:transcriptional regulator with XRE-family HTH domain
MKESSDLGRRVARLRRAAGLSARGLSLAIGASHGVVAQLEGGTIMELRSGLIPNLARALGTSCDYLLTGEGESPSAEQTRQAFAAVAPPSSAASEAA